MFSILSHKEIQTKPHCITEKECMKTIPFTIASKKNQISRCKPNKRCE
jgi:hypothetical protein